MKLSFSIIKCRHIPKLWLKICFVISVFFLCIWFYDEIIKHSNISGNTHVKTKPVPWYFNNGNVQPKPDQILSKTLWPNLEQHSFTDRITEQLMYVPNPKKNKTQTIHFRNDPFYKHYGDPNMFQDCPVTNCLFTEDFDSADAVIFNEQVIDSRPYSKQEQIWILSCLENPEVSCYSLSPSAVNWTATYRSDSDLVTPYGKWVYYNTTLKTVKQEKNYLQGKTKEVAWFVSNCQAWNQRQSYAQELSKYIEVDIYGRCGTKTCPRRSNDMCLNMLKLDYKFYLAFENNNCRDYITEKLFSTALENDLIPIVMGAPSEDYLKSAPFHSFIHVDDFPSPKDLAYFLKELGKDPDMYNNYFQWKNTGEFINTRFHCRLCSMLHSDYETKNYEDINVWYREKNVCNNNSWVT